MSLFVKKFGKYLRRSYNPYTPYNNHKNDKAVSDMKCFNCERPGHFAAECNRPKKDDRYKRDDKRTDARYKKEDRYNRDDKSDERAVDRSKERSKDRRMRTRGDKRSSRKHDHKVLVADESTKSWADTDSESSSSSSSSRDSEQEEVHCLMADQTSDDKFSRYDTVLICVEEFSRWLGEQCIDWVVGCEGERQYRTLISLLGLLATMRRVIKYHSSWARQRQVELFDASGCEGERQYRTLISLLGLLATMRRVVNYHGHGRGNGRLSCLMHLMPPRRRGRGRGQFEESAGYNEDQRSARSSSRVGHDEEEFEVAAPPVERMDVVIARFQRMNPPVFNGDESSEDADSWLRNIIGLFDRVQYDDGLWLSLVTLLLKKAAERWWRGASSTLEETGVGISCWRSGGSGSRSRGTAEAPGSDQFHEEIDTSTVGGCRSPNPVHDLNHNSFSDGKTGGGAWRDDGRRVGRAAERERRRVGGRRLGLCVYRVELSLM
ncbi:hypothetical protein F511_26774 [Dorcoceras hygrometricum]|uniref:CCHC-type domain-containing protein n=1 Tax=Dorcoceras hygrometricum TaxID=472368 RepID=A0A2Z7C2X8_9LAMI|nr:hypothetical protein F511_26774 [Dorcoceras hygrometricum]